MVAWWLLLIVGTVALVVGVMVGIIVEALDARACEEEIARRKRLEEEWRQRDEEEWEKRYSRGRG